MRIVCLYAVLGYALGCLHLDEKRGFMSILITIGIPEGDKSHCTFINQGQARRSCTFAAKDCIHLWVFSSLSAITELLGCNRWRWKLVFPSRRLTHCICHLNQSPVLISGNDDMLRSVQSDMYRLWQPCHNYLEVSPQPLCVAFCQGSAVQARMDR